MKVKSKDPYSKVVLLIFTPIVEPILEWLEQGVTIDDHKYNINRLTQEIEQFVRVNRDKEVSRGQYALLDKVEKVVSIYANESKPDMGEGTDSFLESEICSIKVDDMDIFFAEDDSKVVLLQLSALHCGSFSNSENSCIEVSERLMENIGIALERASWCGSKDKIASALAVSRVCFLGLSNGFLEANYVANIMSQMITTLPPDRWFYSGQVIYGTSFLLRTLLLICKTDYRNQFVDYVNDVREQLLRKVEIKQEKIFNFGEHMPNNASLLLEQMRFNLSIIEISAMFHDLRFLNAALKANDRIYSFFCRLCISNRTTNKNIQNILTALHYITGIKMQEELYNVALCQN
jgi:hypothetical protein